MGDEKKGKRREIFEFWRDFWIEKADVYQHYTVGTGLFDPLPWGQFLSWKPDIYCFDRFGDWFFCVDFLVENSTWEFWTTCMCCTDWTPQHPCQLGHWSRNCIKEQIKTLKFNAFVQQEREEMRGRCEIDRYWTPFYDWTEIDNQTVYTYTPTRLFYVFYPFEFGHTPENMLSFKYRNLNSVLVLIIRLYPS